MHGAVSYQRRYRRCGKANCRRCREGPGHGPYWYATWREGDRVHTRYIGKEPPPHLAAPTEGVEPRDGAESAARSGDGAPPPPAAFPASKADPREGRRSGAGRAVHSPTPTTRKCLRIWTLGRFQIERDGILVTDWHRLAAAAILKRLLIADHGRLARERLIDQLWPDASPDAARDALAGAVHALRRVLEPDLAAGARSRYLAQQGESLVLTLGREDWVDLVAFETLLREAGAAPDPLPRFEAAAALYEGDLLPEETAEWCVAPREALRQRWHGLLLSLAEARAGQRDHEAAAATLGTLLAADPAHEEAARRLMGLLARNGRRTEALRLFRRVERAVREELDAPPAPETVAIAAALHAGAALPFPRPGRASGAASAEPRPALAPLVGRTEEMARLRAALLATREGRGRAVFLAGQAGIGKTRLAEEASMLATTLGFSTLWGRAAEDEHDLPYAPIAEALRAYTRSRPPGALRRDLRGAEAVRLLLPELAETAPGPAAPPLGDSGAERLRLWTAIRALLGAAAESRPLVLILEDLHWADQATLSLLGFLARRPRDSRLLLVGTLRDEEIAESHPLRRMALDGRRDGSLELIALGSLSVVEVGVLAQRQFAAALSGEAVEALHAQGAGNPFFIGELLGVLRERQSEGSGGESVAALLREDAALPRTIRQMLAQRLDRVSPTCRALLRAGAVIGERCGAMLLAHVAGQEQAAFEDALDEGVAAGLLREDSELEGGGYALLHALLRRALYEELLPGQRRRLHERAAKGLIAITPTGREPSAELVASHYARTLDHAAAAHWLEQAGDRAATVHANAAARTQYGLARERLLLCAHEARALGMLDEKLGHVRMLDGDFAGAEQDFARARAVADEPARRAELRRQEGIAWEKRGDFARSLAALAAAEDEGGAAGAGAGLPTTVRAQIEVSRGQTHWRRGDYEDAKAAAERALRLAPDEAEEQMRAQIYSLLGNVARTTGDLARAEDFHRRGLAIRERRGEERELAGSWNNLGMVAHFQGDYARAEECYRASLAICERIGDQPGIGNCWNNLGMVAHFRGAYPRAEEYHLRSLALRERIDDQSGIAGSWNNLGLAALYQSRYRRAEECYQRSLAAHERMGDQQNIASCLNNLGLVAMARGNIDAADAYYRRSLTIEERLSNLVGTAGTLSNLGDVAYERGDYAGARVLYRRARHLNRRAGEPEVQTYIALGQARVYLRSGALHHVQAPLARARALAGAHTLGQAAAHIELLTAEWHRARGAIDPARAAAEAALRLATEGSLLQEQAMARRLLARCAHAEGNFAAAEALLRDAIVTFEAIGAALELARTQAVLAETLAAHAATLSGGGAIREVR